MAYAFTKLFNSITTSTVWVQPDHVRLVWITMLAMADRQGRVMASIPGLASVARVDLPLCEDAIRVLLAPDEYSRTKDYEGRRIEEIDGGWRLLNYGKYRTIRDEEATKEAKRRWWNENRGSSASSLEPTRPKTEAEAEAKAEAKKKESTGTNGRFAPPSLSEVEEFIKAKNLSVDPLKFFTHYESNGWKVGKNPMKKWKMAVWNWSTNER